jgi:hypothetical protein
MQEETWKKKKKNKKYLVKLSDGGFIFDTQNDAHFKSDSKNNHLTLLV